MLVEGAGVLPRTLREPKSVCVVSVEEGPRSWVRGLWGRGEVVEKWWERQRVGWGEKRKWERSRIVGRVTACRRGDIVEDMSGRLGFVADR